MNLKWIEIFLNLCQIVLYVWIIGICLKNLRKKGGEEDDDTLLPPQKSEKP